MFDLPDSAGRVRQLLHRVAAAVAVLAVVASACAAPQEIAASQDSTAAGAPPEVLGFEASPTPDSATPGLTASGPATTPISEHARDNNQPLDKQPLDPAPASAETQSADPGDPGADARLESTTCRFETYVALPQTPECFDLVVPENWEAPGDSEVRIHAAVFRARGDNPQPDPVVYLEGGPGGHALDMLSFTYGPLVAPYVNERDVIVFDQRGAGRSEPSLVCPEAKAVDQLNSEAADEPNIEMQRRLDALGQCHERLQREGVDLSRYNSVSSALDADALRIRLGYTEWNLLGISYGTRLAQTMMRLSPDSIRSVVLDSVVPVAASVLTDLPVSAQRAFDQLFAACADDAACNAEYPDLEERFFALVERLDSEPVRYDVKHLLDGSESTRTATGDDLLGLVFGALYSQSAFAAVPMLVNELESGDTRVLEALGAQQATQGDFLSEGMYLAVECHEEASFATPDDVAGNERFTALAHEITGAGLFGACDFWAAGVADDVENTLVMSDIPTLLMGGAFDPITPPSGMADIAQGLLSSSQVTFGSEGHAVGVTKCGGRVIAAFFNDPSSIPDSACVANMAAPQFVAAGPAPITMVEFDVATTGMLLQGLRPQEWTDVGSAQFVRNATIVDSAALLFQNTFGAPTTELLGSYPDALDLDGPLVAAPSFGDPRGPWLVFTGTSGDDAVTVAVREAGFNGLVAVLMSPADEHAALVDAVLRPAIAAATS